MVVFLQFGKEWEIGMVYGILVEQFIYGMRDCFYAS